MTGGSVVTKAVLRVKFLSLLNRISGELGGVRRAIYSAERLFKSPFLSIFPILRSWIPGINAHASGLTKFRVYRIQEHL